MDDLLDVRMEHITKIVEEDFILTHAVWHNGYGACPETGVWPLCNGEMTGQFELIQHGWRDFSAATPIILSRLRKGWDACRIATFMEKLRARKRPRPQIL